LIGMNIDSMKTRIFQAKISFKGFLLLQIQRFAE